MTTPAPLTEEELAELERLAECAAPNGTLDDWYVVEQPWLPPNAEPYIVAGNPDPHAGKYVCDFVDISIAGHEDEFTDEEWSDRNWALAAFVAASDPQTILRLTAQVRRLEAQLAEVRAKERTAGTVEVCAWCHGDLKDVNSCRRPKEDCPLSASLTPSPAGRT